MADELNIWTESKCLSKKQLLGYLNQTLDREEVYLVETHLNDCGLCSDAIDGLIEQNTSQVQSEVDDIREAIEKKIAAKHPVMHSNAGKRKDHVAPQNNSKPVGFSIHRNKWMVAASLLLVIGLGGLLAYSYLKSRQQQLAQQTPGAVQDAEYNKPAEQEANEISQIQIAPNDMEAPSDVANKNSNDPVKTTTPTQKINPVTPGSNRLNADEAYRNPPAAAIVKAEEQQPETPANTEKATSDVNMDASPAAVLQKDYEESREVPAVVKEAVVSKKSNVGMSNSKMAPSSQNSKQLSYPSNNNSYNDFSNRNESVTEGKQLNEVQTDTRKEINHYAEGMRYFQAGDFKKSIDYLETALKNAPVNQREEIQFQLAQAYLKTGKNRKAEKLLEVLSKGSKYSTESMELLQKAKK